MNVHEKLNYIEFPAKDIAATKAFFSEVFGWQFVDYGPEYTAFSNEGLDGGFFKAQSCSSVSSGASLLIFYSNNIEATQAKVERSGGIISTPLFAFPGGRRFHFIEPSGNELAVWTDVSL